MGYYRELDNLVKTCEQWYQDEIYYRLICLSTSSHFKEKYAKYHLISGGTDGRVIAIHDISTPNKDILLFNSKFQHFYTLHLPAYLTTFFLYVDHTNTVFALLPDGTLITYKWLTMEQQRKIHDIPIQHVSFCDSGIAFYDERNELYILLGDSKERLAVKIGGINYIHMAVQIEQISDTSKELTITTVCKTQTTLYVIKNKITENDQSQISYDGNSEVFSRRIAINKISISPNDQFISMIANNHFVAVDVDGISDDIINTPFNRAGIRGLSWASSDIPIVVMKDGYIAMLRDENTKEIKLNGAFLLFPSRKGVLVVTNQAVDFNLKLSKKFIDIFIGKDVKGQAVIRSVFNGSCINLSSYTNQDLEKFKSILLDLPYEPELQRGIFRVLERLIWLSSASRSTQFKINLITNVQSALRVSHEMLSEGFFVLPKTLYGNLVNQSFYYSLCNLRKQDLALEIAKCYKIPINFIQTDAGCMQLFKHNKNVFGIGDIPLCNISAVMKYAYSHRMMNQSIRLAYINPDVEVSTTFLADLGKIQEAIDLACKVRDSHLIYTLFLRADKSTQTDILRRHAVLKNLVYKYNPSYTRELRKKAEDLAKDTVMQSIKTYHEAVLTKAKGLNHWENLHFLDILNSSRTGSLREMVEGLAGMPAFHMCPDEIERLGISAERYYMIIVKEYIRLKEWEKLNTFVQMNREYTQLCAIYYLFLGETPTNLCDELKDAIQCIGNEKTNEELTELLLSRDFVT